MAEENLIWTQEDGTVCFGNHQLPEKAKKEDFEHAGDLYKVKTYREMTRLEKNGMFLYESEPGTTVYGFQEKADGVGFSVEAAEDAQITVGLEDDTEYDVFMDGMNCGRMKTNLGGKLSFSVELGRDRVDVKVKK